MTQDSLHRLRFDLCLVHQPVAKRVTKVVQSEPLMMLGLFQISRLSPVLAFQAPPHTP
jgi:hypothetical protein